MCNIYCFIVVCVLIAIIIIISIHDVLRICNQKLNENSADPIKEENRGESNLVGSFSMDLSHLEVDEDPFIDDFKEDNIINNICKQTIS